MKTDTGLAKKLVEEYGTRDPFQIAFMLDVAVKYIDTKRQKGLCAVFDGIPFIFINQNLSEEMRRMTCAHELGHILLHKDILNGNIPLLEYELFNIQSNTEYEANVFAADLLIDEEELRERLSNEQDMVAAASAMNVNVNLLMIRVLELQKEQDGLRIPFHPQKNFLGTIGDNAGSINGGSYE